MATNRDRPAFGVGAQKYGSESDDQGSNSLIASTSQHSSHSPNLAAAAAAAATAFRILRMEWEEMEMIKAREISRWEGQKRRMEAEAELTQMMLQTQLLVAGRVVGRERKRVDDEESNPFPQGKKLCYSICCNAASASEANYRPTTTTTTTTTITPPHFIKLSCFFLRQ